MKNNHTRDELLNNDQQHATWSLGLFLAVFVLAGLLTLLRPAPEHVRIQLPTTEKVGEVVGGQAARFTKGFVKGVVGESKKSEK